MDWANAECLEKEKRLIPRKILESAHIRANRERCLNLNEGIGVTEWKGELVEEGKGGGIKQRKTNCVYSDWFSSDLKDRLGYPKYCQMTKFKFLRI
jgi:hypothetical protein